MKSDSQFVRWGIPGWMVAVSFITFIMVDYVSANDNRMFEAINSLISSNGNIWELVFAGFLVAGAGIPIGFLIYQIYFYLRWVSPVSKNGLFPPFLHGRMAEMKDSLRNIDINILAFDKTWRKTIIEETKDHRSIWQYISPILLEAVVALDKDDIFHKHMSYLKETLHSLGASHLGFSFGFFFYLLAKWKTGQAPLSTIALAIIVPTFTVYFLSKEDHGRKRFHDANVFKYVDTPSELFVSSLFFLYLTLNPAINKLVPFYVLWLILLIIIILWGVNVQENKWGIWSLFLFLTIIVFIIYGFTTYTKISVDINWPILLAILIYNSITVVFLKIRQNTVEALTSFQYYLTMLFLEKQNTPLE